MLIDRYTPEDVFARVPQLAAQIDPLLKQMDVLLDDDQWYQQVRMDLGKRYRLTLVHGRHSTPVEVILRLLLIKHLYHWSYQETLERAADSLVLRWCCRVYCQRLPDESTLIRWAHAMRPETLQSLNDRVVELAAQARVTKGRKLPVDATCVQTTIHHPTDSGLLVDSVRLLSRFVQRAKPLMKDQPGNVGELCRSRLRSARRVAQSLHRLLRRKSETKESEQQNLYRRVINTTEQMLRQARRVIQTLSGHSEKVAHHLLPSAQNVLPLIERVISQARVRVLQQKQVESREKVLSLHEPHTRAIPRHKGGAQIEFGRQVMLDEVEGGIVPRSQVLADGESDRGQGLVALAHHKLLFGHPPRIIAGDRGIHSNTTQGQALAAGVKVVAIPALGRGSRDQRAKEHSRRWKRAYRWRAGIEGRIHSLRRDYGLSKCAYHGEFGMQCWIGLGVIASNLRHIAQAMVA